MGSVFFDWNIAVCNRIERLLPANFVRSLVNQHDLLIDELINTYYPKKILDLGCGKHTSFKKYLPSYFDTIIIGVDINENNLKNNNDVDCKVVTDLCACLPFDDSSVNLISTTSVIKHLKNTNEFFQKTCRT